ncbi:hypothetical protein BC332_22759 [Capsicum chinense]|nr:hypothetical protein BC332_22759 [Capsicum chinense]
MVLLFPKRKQMENPKTGFQRTRRFPVGEAAVGGFCYLLWQRSTVITGDGRAEREPVLACWMLIGGRLTTRDGGEIEGREEEDAVEASLPMVFFCGGSERTISLVGWGVTGVSRALIVRDAHRGQGPGSGHDQNGIIRVAPVSALSMWARVQTEFRQILVRIIDPLVFFYRKGNLPCLLADPDCLVDLVPVDMVVNATMAAIAKHGYLQNPELNVYHLASSSQNPVIFSQFFDYSYDLFQLFPFVNSKGDKFQVSQWQHAKANGRYV